MNINKHIFVEIYKCTVKANSSCGIVNDASLLLGKKDSAKAEYRYDKARDKELPPMESFYHDLFSIYIFLLHSLGRFVLRNERYSKSKFLNFKKQFFGFH